MNTSKLITGWGALLLHLMLTLLLFLSFNSSSLAQVNRVTTLFPATKVPLQACCLSFPRPACATDRSNCGARNCLFYTDGVQSWDRTYLLGTYRSNISFSDSSVQRRYAALIWNRSLR